MPTIREQLDAAVKLLADLGPVVTQHAFAPCWRGIVDTFPTLVLEHVRLFGELGVDIAYDYSKTLAYITKNGGRCSLSVTVDPLVKFSRNVDPRDYSNPTWQQDHAWLIDRCVKLAETADKHDVIVSTVMCEQENWRQANGFGWINGRAVPLTGPESLEWDTNLQAHLLRTEKILAEHFPRAVIQWCDLGAPSINLAGGVSTNRAYPSSFAHGRSRSCSLYEGDDIDRMRLRYCVMSQMAMGDIALNPCLGAGVDSPWDCDTQQPTRGAVLSPDIAWQLGYEINVLQRTGRSPNPVVCDWSRANRVLVWPGLGRSDRWGDGWLPWYVAYLAGANSRREAVFRQVPPCRVAAAFA